MGPDSRELIFSGDPLQDKKVAREFAAGYDVMHRWRTMTDGSQVLIVGADNFPLPIPLKNNGAGSGSSIRLQESTRFSPAVLATMNWQLSKFVARLQTLKVRTSHNCTMATRQDTTKFISDPGKQNGLYWKSPEGQPESPLGPLVAFATSEGYSTKSAAHVPFHGYYFHMLKGQTRRVPGAAMEYIVNGKMTDGFAFVTYSGEYRNSGVMTFMINQDGVLVRKDLGKNTTQTATAMTEFDPDPDPSWTPVEE